MTSFVLKYFYVNKNACSRVINFASSQKNLLNKRSYTSALYIPGNKANKTFAYLSPDLDFNERFSDISKLQNELDLRKIKIDAKELHKTWSYYEYVVSNRQVLENKIDELNDKIKNINKSESLPINQETVDSLVLQIRMIKQELRTVKQAIWDLEESVIPQALKLPNEIDNDTPSENSVILKVVGEKTILPDHKKKNHVDIGKNLGLLDYISPVHCFLCNEAVSFELEILAQAGKILNQNGAMRVTGPDFCRSIIVEGCGIKHESPTETFLLQNNGTDKEYLVNQLHLVGSASLPALISSYIKQTMNHKYFPIKVYTTGRQYNPFSNTSVNYGLFSLSQASVVQALVLTKKKDCNEYRSEFENLVEMASKIYASIGCHYRVVIRSVQELLPSESMRVSFEMWSVHSEQYLEVGYVSAFGDYLSKRLLIGCGSNKVDYSAVISGTLLNVPRVLGCLIEEDADKYILSKKLQDLS